ncbi:MAG TPA: tetratricopeptide repeat protein [Candidatus Sulfotelmatobacter sp.]|nr:tetratricopeptide repeat protein [Candidatus Sulfotelmatobacter sp.]
MRLLRAFVALIVFVAATAAPARPAPPATAPVADGAGLVDAARAKLASGDGAGALALLQPYVAQHPTDIAAGRLLGDVYFRVPDFGKAEAAWKAVVKVDPTDRETHNRLGALYAAEDRVPEATLEFERSLPLAEGYAGLVRQHQRLGDIDQWIAEIQEAIDKNPLDADKISLIGHVYEYLHQNELALLAYRKVVNLRPTSCGPRVDLSNVLVETDQYDQAIGELHACLARDPKDYAAIINLGDAYLHKGEQARGASYIDQALALNPMGFEALVDHGYVLDENGDWKDAIVFYNRALAIDPTRPEAYIDLGFDYAGQHLFALAEAAYLKGLSVAADDGTLHYLLGQTYDEQGKVSLAREQYRAASHSPEKYIAQQARAELGLLPPQ